MSEQINTDVLTEVHGRLGCITLNRPKALNALSLDMVKTISRTLSQWQPDPEILAVVVRDHLVLFAREVISASSIRQRLRETVLWTISSQKNMRSTTSYTLTPSLILLSWTALSWVAEWVFRKGPV